MTIFESKRLPITNRDEYIVDPKETILITGANGFIGSKVVQMLIAYGFSRLRCLVRSERNLEKLHSIIIKSKAKVDVFKGNLLSRGDCIRAAEGVSIVYHLAAGVEKSFPGCFLNSAVSTRNLLDALLNNNMLKRFVNVSTIAVYSNEKISRKGLLDESCEIDKKFFERWDAYTYGKAKQDEILIETAKNHNLSYVIVRPGVVFGPGKAQITGRVGIDTFGIFLHLGLRNSIPFTYVDNCAEAVVLAGLKKNIDGQVFNILDDYLPKSFEFLKLYKRNVRDFFSIPIPYRVWYFLCYIWEKYSIWSEGQIPPVFNRRRCSTYWKGNQYSNIKAKKLLGWRPRIAMKEALERYFDYMKKEEIQ